ncbi:MAG: branched-chain amino acid ABC transporter permease [Bacillota bacterium]
MRHLTPTRFWLLLGAVMAALPWLYSSDVYRHLLIITCFHAILALSLNLVTGFTGQLSLGHSAFVAAGAYTSALLTLSGASFWTGALAAGVVAFLLGLLVGLPSLRLQGIYLGMVTWGLAEIVRLTALNLDITRGPMGLPGIPAISVFGTPLFKLWQIYYVVGGLLFLCIIGTTRLVDSRIGDALLAIREDGLAAGAMGINTLYYKVLIFGVSATVAGVAGAFYGSYLTFISPQAFDVNMSILILMMVVVGGLGSIPGSLLGAVILTLLPEAFRFLSDYRLWFYGAILIFMMIFRPQGILGAYRHLLPRLVLPAALTGAKGGGDHAARRA